MDAATTIFRIIWLDPLSAVEQCPLWPPIVLQNDFERWSEEHFSEIARQCGILILRIRSFGFKSCPLLADRQLVGDFCNTMAPKPDISLHRHKRRKGRECDMGPHKPYGLAPAFT